MIIRKTIQLCCLSSLSVATLLTAGCAAIVGGLNQPVSVAMREPDGYEIQGAQCSLQNSKGTWYVTTPGSVTIHRAYGDLRISCNKAGQTIGTATSISSVRGWMFGNILFGGIIGAGVDIGTGAGFDYPNTVTVASNGRFRAFEDDPSVAADDQTTSTVATIPSRPVAVPASTPAVGPAGSIAGDHPITGSDTATELAPVRRQVTSGAVTMVAAHADSTRMCSTHGPLPSIQVLDGSQHGKLEIKQGEFVPPGGRASDACKSGKIYGTQIYYQPEAGFRGTDHVRYSVMAATGKFTRTVDIEVN